ncbi:MAG: ABC transporter ATP-binding protein [Burkholderiaceae bacterium]
MESLQRAVSAPPVLELQKLTKVYSGFRANDDVSLGVAAGEIHAVLGENGAGKSTLMKMVYGVVQPTAGQILWRGRPVQVSSPMVARRLGIGMVFQHFSLFESLTVAENTQLFLDDGQSLSSVRAALQEFSSRYGLEVQPDRHVHDLSVGERQRVEILRCLLQSPKLLILDEPTSVLTPQEVERLFAMLERLSSEGCAILYISHKLQEIQRLCHRATVLQSGRVTGNCIPSQETHASLVAMMIGSSGSSQKATVNPNEDLSQTTLPSAPKDLEREMVGAAAASMGPRPLLDRVRGLKVQDLSVPSVDPFGVSLKNLSFSVEPGEILGLAGVSGNGQRELLKVLSGEIRIDNAQAILINGKPAGCLSVSRRRRGGLGIVPEDRLGTGAVPDFSLSDNAFLTALYTKPLLSWAGLIRHHAVNTFARDIISSFHVKARSENSPARSLSGGNLQKFIVGRELLQHPSVLVCEQPTWGVDVNAASQLRQALRHLRDQGCAILLISEDLDELFELTDRVMVAFQGRLSTAQPTAASTPQSLGLLMSGVWQ